MAHEHYHSSKTYNRAFLIGTGLNIGFVRKELHHHFDIDHSTLQIETGDREYPCHLEPESHL